VSALTRPVLLALAGKSARKLGVMTTLIGYRSAEDRYMPGLVVAGVIWAAASVAGVKW
jgi:hypothetical protein